MSRSHRSSSSLVAGVIIALLCVLQSISAELNLFGFNAVQDDLDTAGLEGPPAFRLSPQSMNEDHMAALASIPRPQFLYSETSSFDTMQSDDITTRIVTSPLFATQTVTQFNLNYTCAANCLLLTTLEYIPITDPTGVTYTSIDMVLLYADKNLVNDPLTWTKYTLQFVPGTTSVPLPSVPTDSVVIIFGTITYGEDHYDPDQLEPVIYSTGMEFKTSAGVVAHHFDLETYWGDELLFPNMPDIVNPPVPDPNTYNFDFVVKPQPFYIQSTANAYRFLATFIQYQWSFIQHIDLNLHGTNRWTFNTTAIALGLEYCSVNGQNITPTIVNPQTIRLSLSSIISESLIASAPLTLMCGDESNYIVQDSRFKTALGTDAPPELLSILPHFALVEGFKLPQLSHTINLDTGAYQLIPYTPTGGVKVFSVSPETAFIDANGAGIYSTFTIEFDDLEQYSNPFEVKLAFLGLQRNPQATTINPPQVFITLSGDYTNDHPENKLQEVVHIVDLDTTTWQTKTLRCDSGFDAVYLKQNPPTFFFAGAKPKRYIQITVPLEPLVVEYYPVSTLLAIKPVTSSSSSSASHVQPIISLLPRKQQQQQQQQPSQITTQQTDPVVKQTLMTLSTYASGSGTVDPTQLSYKINKVKKNQVKFDITPINNAQIFPDRFTIAYPAGDLRLKYPTVTSPVCYMLVRVCSGSGKSRSCYLIRDRNWDFTPTHQSQYQFDLAVIKYTDSVPGIYRTFVCIGVKVESTTQSVLDFKGASGDVLIASQPVRTGAKSDITKTGVGPVVSNQVYSGGSLYGYSELYKVSNGISSTAIVMLALIPVWIICLVVPLVVICICCCDD